MKQLSLPMSPAKQDKPLTRDDLSKDQLEVYGAIAEWFSNGKGGLLTIGGLAGVGKSSLLGVFSQELRSSRVAYCAYTGRAASILKRKLKASGTEVYGLPFHPLMAKSTSFRAKWSGVFSKNPDSNFCGTLHRLLYKPLVNEEDEIIGWSKREELDRKYDLIVVDEASMVSSEMLDDLKKHDVPILAVGDHGQLPPVMSSGSVVQNPDLRLEKIHRQAEGNPIIALAHHVRSGERLSHWPVDSADDRLRFLPKFGVQNVLKAAYASNASLGVATLCWTNRTRVNLNKTARRALGCSGLPTAGETIIYLKNNPPIFNGMRGVLTADAVGDPEGPRPWELSLHVDFPEDGLTNRSFIACSAQFNREKTIGEMEELKALGIDVKKIRDAGELVDFGYAMTVHKSQGSGFDHVVLYVDRPERPDDEDWRRFYYTAITRAAKRLTVLL